jgi:hypothetical protein
MFGRLEAIAPSTERRVRRLGRSDETRVTAAWCVARAVRHAGEHRGQVQLTHYLFDARASR